MQNFLQTVISQYINSPTLMQLIKNFNQYIDPTTNLNNFYNMIFNVDTAQGYGLDCWGRIVGVNRVLQVTQGLFFGFQEAGSGAYLPFNQGQFYTGQPTTSNYALSDDAFRTLIFAKALANISDGSIPSINQILINLFGTMGNCYVQDNNDMSLTYVFDFTPSAVDQAIIENSGVLPRPTGVSTSIIYGA